MRSFALLSLVLGSTSVLAQSPGGIFSFAKNLVSTSLTGQIPNDWTYLGSTDDEAKVVRVDDGNASVLDQGNWVVLIHAPPRTPHDKPFVQVHTNASQLYHDFSPDLSDETPNEEFHFARVDYVTAVQICTRWMVWRPPKIVIITNEGSTRSMRFLSVGNIPLNGTTLFRALTDEAYRQAPVWQSRWGPGGDRAWIVDYYIAALAKWTEKTSRIPGFVWLMLSGAVAKELLGWLHGGRAPARPTVAATAAGQGEGEAAGEGAGAGEGEAAGPAGQPKRPPSKTDVARAKALLNARAAASKPKSQ